MGKVYKVYHRGWGKHLAVKSPRLNVFASGRGAELFQRECEMWVNLGLHPNVASCFYVRRIDGIPRVFAEYVSGGTLYGWVQKARLYSGDEQENLARMIDVACQLARGLQYAHDQGLVHQDVKTSNVLMTKDGVAKVTDFGLSKAIAAARQTVPTGKESPATARGTAVYCSPEQARRDALTQATDIWSWAVCVLEMFVGDITWMAGQTAGEALETYLELGPEQERIPEMPNALTNLLRRCFRPRPEDRPGDMAKLVAELESIYERAVGEPYPRKPPEPEAISADRLNNRAASILDLGNQQKAEQLWTQALQAEPDHPEARYNRALDWWRRGRITDTAAARELMKLCDRVSDPSRAQYLLAHIHLERGDIPRAYDIFRRIKPEALPDRDIRRDRAQAKERMKGSKGLVHTFGAHGGPIESVCLSWDGRLALSGSAGPDRSGQLTLWEIPSGECLNRFNGHTAPVTTACFAADGVHIVSGAADGTVRAWHSRTGECERVIQAHEGTIKDVRVTADQRTVLTAGADGLIRLWDVLSGACVQVCAGHTAAVTSIELGGFGHRVFSTSADGTFRVWEVKTGRCIHTFRGDGTPLTALTVSSNQLYAVTAGSQGQMTFWNTKTLEPMKTRRAHSDPITSVCLSKDMYYAVSATPEGKARIWELSTNRCLHSFTARAPLSLSADGKHALSGEPDGTLKLWAVGCDAPPIPAPLMICQTSPRADED